MTKKPIIIFDTTSRDGQQGEGMEFSAEKMLQIAIRLDEIGVHYIECGWPGTNPRFDEFFELARGVKLKNAKLVAFSSTRKKNTSIKEDKIVSNLLNAGTPAVAIFGKSWKLHVYLMKNTLKENLAMISETVAFAKANEKEGIYDAEHFFDGYKDDAKYAMKTLWAAVNAGADWITLCDTNGGTLPHEIEVIVSEVRRKLGKNVRLGIHAHNDCNMAVANSVAAVRKGAEMVQGTINGYGERAGNADLTSVIPILQLKMDYDCIGDNIAKLKELSGFVSEVANMTPFNGRPFVGKSAFMHKGGVHVDAVRKNSKAYEHMSPELVGNVRRVVVSDLSGKGNIEYKLDELGINLEEGYVDSKMIANEIKRLENEGFKFEAAEDSFRLLVENLSGKFTPLFRVESLNIITIIEEGRPARSVATVSIVNNKGVKEITAAEADGPVEALDKALRKGLSIFFPTDLEALKLVDFKVRVIDGKEGTGAKVRTLIESRHGGKLITTVGVSNDIIASSFQALLDSFHAVITENGNGKQAA